MTAARKENSFYAGLHSFADDYNEAFVVRWLTRADGARPGWYWADAAGGLWRGPATSSRAAYKDARASRLAAPL